jgi:Family of unknown function (DUF695)
MGIFGRRKSGERSVQAQASAISAFWAWWQDEGASQIAAAISAGDPERLVPVLSARVQAIDPGLAWELGSGTVSQHLLVVSPEGDPALRALARRWLRTAPSGDPVWAYADARPGAADPEGVVLTIVDAAIDVASAVAGARVAGAALDVQVFHPAFPELPDDARQIAAILLVDAVLGEAAAQTWIGTVQVANAPPLDAVPLVGLLPVVRELSSSHTDAAGQPHWAVLEGRTPNGERVLAMAQIPLRSAVAPHLDVHVAVAVPYASRTPEGLPAPESLQPLRDLEAHLTARLADAARLVAHETHQGLRTFHFYAEAGTPAAEQLRVAAAGWDQGTVRVDSAQDPGWARVAHLRG